MVTNKQLIRVLNEVRNRKAIIMADRKRRPINEVIKTTSDTLLKQLSSYWSGLPAGELRKRIGEHMKKAEELSAEIRETFPDEREKGLDDDFDAGGADSI